MFQTRSPRLARMLSLLTLVLLTAPSAFAGTSSGASAAATNTAEGRLSSFLLHIQNLFTGPVGTSIGIIAFAAAGVYIMYARQTGQAVGAIAKVFVGLLILFGGTALVGVAAGGAF